MTNAGATNRKAQSFSEVNSPLCSAILRIRTESAGVGKRTLFTFTLPVAEENFTAERPA